MMYSIQYLDEHLQGHIDFATFRLLAIIPRGKMPPVVMLVPRYANEPQNFNLQVGTRSLWFGSLDNMLRAAGEYYHIGKFWLQYCHRRYDRLQKQIRTKTR